MPLPSEAFGELRAKAREALHSCRTEGFFLRRSRDESFLLVSDMPRLPEWEHAAKRLRAAGFIVRHALGADIAHIDASRGMYARLTAGMENALGEGPCLPRRRELHPAYAMYQLLSLHGEAPPETGFDALRSLIKSIDEGERAALVFIAGAHESCAARLRSREPMPAGLRAALGAWLIEKETEV